MSRKNKKKEPFLHLVGLLRENQQAICSGPVEGLLVLDLAIRKAEEYAAKYALPPLPNAPSPAKVLEVLSEIRKDMENPVGYPPPEVCERRHLRREAVKEVLLFVTGVNTGAELRAWTEGKV